jgi:hypothetical protein
MSPYEHRLARRHRKTREQRLVGHCRQLFRRVLANDDLGRLRRDRSALT